MTPENLEKKIKKNIYGKGQKIKITFPAGLGDTALQEIQFILKNLWFPQKFTSESYLLKNEIYIKNIHMTAITELLMRNQCLTDLRLVILEGKSLGKKAFKQKCEEVPWDFYLNKNMSLKLKINSIASKAFHETALKEILKEILEKWVKTIVTGENSTETTCLYADLYKDKLTLSLSLAGLPLYKRGYRGILSASAPLREDYAACLLEKALQFANDSFNLRAVVIPFSGTGTFAFEFLQIYFNFSPVLFNRAYALQKMPLFRKENFEFLLKKAKENALLPPFTSHQCSTLQLYCIDQSNEANQAFFQNLQQIKTAVSQANLFFPEEALFPATKENQPFFSYDLFNADLGQLIQSQKLIGDVFMPLNPPYGIRLNKQSNAVDFYKNIAKKINELSIALKKNPSNLLGFILCPDVETWSIFIKTLNSTRRETYHFTQGGKDIRVCQFYIMNRK